jgi:hypothetical protein
MLTPGASEFLHVVGYLTGTALYAMLLAMVIRRSPVDRLTLSTAVLGCVWSAGELSALALRSAGLAGSARWFHACSYSALGLLGAVVVHAVARFAADAGIRGSEQVRRVVATVAYGCAAVASALHLLTAATGGPLPSGLALGVITIGLAVLVAPLIVVTRRQANGTRALWMGALGLFAVSAVHLAGFHVSGESWPAELVGHHASIPLAFAILYQDYRFALADLFLKQALALVSLVIVASLGFSLAAPLLASPVGTGVLLSLWAGTALMFPWLRRAIVWFVDRVILQRVNYTQFLDVLNADLQTANSVEDVLDRSCAHLARALTATSVTWNGSLDPASQEVPIVTTDEPRFMLRVGPLAGGRRLLSDDSAMLERASVVIARRIDALRLTGERYEHMLREREIRALASEAELRALRAQVNPHFLFNALTTVGYLIEHAPARALDTLIQLTTLLRGSLRSDGEFTTLGRELDLIACYLRIEHARFEERLQVEVDVPQALHGVEIPSLLVQPLVENAIKHGIAGARDGGVVQLTARVPSGTSPVLHVQVRNTGAPIGEHPTAGVGLRTVRERLASYYGDAASFRIRGTADGATVAEITLPIGEEEDPNVVVASRSAGR